LFDGALRTGNEDELIMTPIKDGGRGPLSYFSGTDSLSVHFTQSGKTLLYPANGTTLGTAYQGLYYADLTTAPPYQPAQLVPTQTLALKVSLDASLAVYASGDTYARRLDGVMLDGTLPRASLPIMQMSNPNSYIQSYAISADNRYVSFVQVDDDGSKFACNVYSVAVGESPTATPRKLSTADGGWCDDVIITPDGQWVLYSMSTNSVPHAYLLHISDPSRHFELSSVFPIAKWWADFQGFLP
jgi:hypothetical protein